MCWREIRALRGLRYTSVAWLLSELSRGQNTADPSDLLGDIKLALVCIQGWVGLHLGAIIVAAYLTGVSCLLQGTSYTDSEDRCCTSDDTDVMFNLQVLWVR
jgi:hypothetical protein